MQLNRRIFLLGSGTGMAALSAPLAALQVARRQASSRLRYPRSNDFVGLIVVHPERTPRPQGMLCRAGSAPFDSIELAIRREAANRRLTLTKCTLSGGTIRLDHSMPATRSIHRVAFRLSADRGMALYVNGVCVGTDTSSAGKADLRLPGGDLTTPPRANAFAGPLLLLSEESL